MDPENKTNEMDDSYANGDYQSMDMPTIPMVVPITSDSEDSTIAIGSPVSDQHDVKNVTVYANSITPVSYGDSDPVVAFDVVFSVGIFCGDGSTKTYQVVKRIGVDRMKMAADAQSTTPVSIVEEKKPLKEDKFFSTARMMALAGLK